MELFGDGDELGAINMEHNSKYVKLTLEDSGYCRDEHLDYNAIDVDENYTHLENDTYAGDDNGTDYFGYPSSYINGDLPKAKHCNINRIASFGFDDDGSLAKKYYQDGGYHKSRMPPS